MARIIKITAGNQEINGLAQDFNIQREEWNDYTLLDGGTVRVKTTVLRIYQVVDDDGAPRNNTDGSPMMVVQHKTDIVSAL